MNEFAESLFGVQGMGYFLTLFFWALIGATINLTMGVNKRDALSESTPVAFSIKFLLLDNWKRMLNSFLVIWVMLRFYPEILPKEVYDAIPETAELLFAVLIGFSFDKLSEIIKEKANILSVNREKIKGND